MTHKRKNIRETIVQALQADVSLVDSLKIFESRVEPLWSKLDLPCICVYTRKETGESFNDHHKISQRELELAVEVLVQGNASSDDDLDAICEQVESSLMKPENEVNEYWQFIDYNETEIAFGESGRIPVAAARMIFGIEYEIEYNL